MRHGELHGSMTAFLLLDQLAPCECGHPQQDHDEDDCCTRCDCDLFRDGKCPTCGDSDRDGGTVATSGPDEFGNYETDDCPDGWHR